MNYYAAMKSSETRRDIRVSQRIPKEMDADLKALAQELGIRRAEIVRCALYQYISKTKASV